MTNHRTALHSALDLARRGNPDQALADLETGLLRAMQENDERWIVHFARNCAIVAEHLGKLEECERFYEVAPRFDNDDGYLHFAAAQLAQRLGKRAEADLHFARCAEIAKRTDDHELFELLHAAGIAWEPSP